MIVLFAGERVPLEGVAATGTRGGELGAGSGFALKELTAKRVITSITQKMVTKANRQQKDFRLDMEFCSKMDMATVSFFDSTSINKSMKSSSCQFCDRKLPIQTN